MQDCGLDMKQAINAYNKLCTQPDLLNEFFLYTKNKAFKTFYPAVAGDNMYTADQIYKTKDPSKNFLEGFHFVKLEFIGLFLW